MGYKALTLKGGAEGSILKRALYGVVRDAVFPWLLSELSELSLN